MWLGFSHLFSCKCMYAGGVNFTSLLFMNVYRIYLIILICQKEGKDFLKFCFCPFVDDWQKKGEWFWVYMHCLESLYAYLEKGGEWLWDFYAWLLTIDIIYACLFLQLVSSIYVFVYAKGEKHSSLMHVCIEHSLHIFMFSAMHELKGSFYET